MSDAGEAQPREQVPVGGADGTPGATAEPLGASTPRRIMGAAPGATPFRPRAFGDRALEPQPDGSPDRVQAERVVPPVASPVGSAEAAPTREQAEPPAVDASEVTGRVDPVEMASVSEAMASAPPGAFEAEATSSSAVPAASDGASSPWSGTEQPHPLEPSAPEASPTMESPPAVAASIPEAAPPIESPPAVGETSSPAIATPATARPLASEPTPSDAAQPPLQPPAVAPRPAAPPAHLSAVPPPSEQARSELRRRRDALAEEVTELHWDLGGLAYEMAIRDHFRLDVLVRRAAVLQERDAELAELERLLQMEEGGIAGSCPNCGAPHSRGAVYCWQCGAALMQRAQSSVLPGSDPSTVIMDGLRPAGSTEAGPAPHNGSDG